MHFKAGDGGRVELGKFWTLPNMLSLARLVIVIPVSWLILVDGSLLWILGLVLLALTTDYFDGRVARWSHSVSGWGKVLDPFADKIGGGMVIAALTYREALPLWFFVAIISRDLAIVCGGVLIRWKTGEFLMSLNSGKVAISAVSITVLAALLQADPPIMRFCLIVSTALLTYSLLRYLIRFILMLRSSGGAAFEESPDHLN